MNVLPVCMYVYQDPLELGLRDGCKLPCACWELNWGPLQEQPLLLTKNQSLKLFSMKAFFPLCSPVCPVTHYADQAGLELRDLLASAS